MKEYQSTVALQVLFDAIEAGDKVGAIAAVGPVISGTIHDALAVTAAFAALDGAEKTFKRAHEIAQSRMSKNTAISEAEAPRAFLVILPIEDFKHLLETTQQEFSQVDYGNRWSSRTSRDLYYAKMQRLVSALKAASEGTL